MVAERLGLRVEDGTVLVGGHGTKLQPLGQGCVGDVVEGRAAHHEEPAEPDEPLLLEQRDVPDLGLVGEPARLERPAVGLQRAPSFDSAQVLVQERATEATPPVIRMDAARDVEHGHARADGPLDRRLADDLAVDLGDDDVMPDVAGGRTLELLAELGRRGQPRDVVLGVGGADQRRGRLVVGLVGTMASEAKPLDRRGIRELEPGRRIERGVGGHGSVSVVVPPAVRGSGLVQSTSSVSISNPSEPYRVIAWLGLRPSTPR